MKTVWIPGVVSATFKNPFVPADQVIRYTVENHLKAIEWSENVHVKPDDPEGAAKLRAETEAAGLAIAAYGSYFRLGENEHPEEVFRKSLVSAEALGAKTIRIWAGSKASADADDTYRVALVKEASLVASMAAEKDIKIAFEWHKNTLTDTNESAMQLLRDADNDNLYCLWQPTVALTPRQRTEGIRMLGSRMVNFHVYSWPDGKRGPLNMAEWAYYLDAASDIGSTHYCLLEFVRDNTPEQFASDAAALLKLLEDGGYTHG